MIKYMKFNDEGENQMIESEFLNKLVKDGNVYFKNYHVVMTKTQYLISDSNAPDTYNPVRKFDKHAAGFWLMWNFLNGMEA